MYKHQIIPKDYSNMHMSAVERKVVQREMKNFKILANIIEAFGPFIYQNVAFQPFLPELETPNAFGITYSNLRSTVVALSSSSEETREKRWTFYKHNSLPGAIWSVDEGSKDAVLTNPDTIIRADYNLEEDYRQFTDCLRAISQLYDKYIGTLSYSGQGDQCQLVSILERCKDRIPDPVNEHGSVRFLAPADNELVAYGYGRVTPETMCRGIITLYGEHCKTSVNYDTWGCRSDLTGSSSICKSWENCIFTSFNNFHNHYDPVISVPPDFTIGTFALPLPISTRGVGFAVSYIYHTLADHLTLYVTIHQLFRASLLQLQFRMFKSTESKDTQLVVPKNFFNVFLNISDPRFIRPPKNNFKIIASIINKVGPFLHGDAEYHPGVPATQIPDPFNVTIDNLRETVVALSDGTPETRETRWKFYRHNSIPGSVWRVNEIEEDAVLTNADQIMPNEYNSSEDLSALVRCMSDIELKEPLYIGNIKYFGPGNPCQLVNVVENCTDFIRSSDNIASHVDGSATMYKHFPPTTRGFTSYTRGHLNTQQMLMGILGLYGEHCKYSKDYEMWGCRSPSVGSYSSPSILWNTVARFCEKLDM